MKNTSGDLSATQEFADEEVASNHGYFWGYKLKPIAEQVKILRDLLPELGSADEALVTAPLPEGAEGYFAIPRWEKIAPTYGEAVEKVFALLAKARHDWSANYRGWFVNHRKGQLGAKYLRQHAKTAAAFQKLGEAQSTHDILIVPAQFGLRHRGRSVRRARAVMGKGEFGLGTFAVAIMLLTHPKRLVEHADLWIDCAGDEFAPGADDQFVLAPDFRFFFFDDQVGFVAHFVDDAGEVSGSASGFLPQQDP